MLCSAVVQCCAVPCYAVHVRRRIDDMTRAHMDEVKKMAVDVEVS